MQGVYRETGKWTIELGKQLDCGNLLARVRHLVTRRSDHVKRKVSCQKRKRACNTGEARGHERLGASLDQRGIDYQRETCGHKREAVEGLCQERERRVKREKQRVPCQMHVATSQSQVSVWQDREVYRRDSKEAAYQA